MNFNQLVIETFLSEASSKKLLLLDIDDTLLTPTGMKIYRKLPSDASEVALTPEQYAKEGVKPENKKYYDYRDFRDPEKVKNSIKFGNPIVPNLKIMDSFVNKGWSIGILTARALEDEIHKAIREFLKIKTPEGNLEDVGDKVVPERVFAVNDASGKYAGATDYEKKKNVILSLLPKYDKITFIDDDVKNIDAIKELKKSLDDKESSKISVIQAKKPAER